MTVYYIGMDALWRIDQLSQQAEHILHGSEYKGQQSARIREVPDVRTIRYYTTVGLLDRPAEMRGRTAYYGRRHLLQLVAIKQLQCQGRSLVEIQQKLFGATDTELKTIAGVTDQDLATAITAPDKQEVAPVAQEAASSEQSHADSPPNRRFWEQQTQQTASGPGELITRAAVILPVAAGASLVLEGISGERLATLLPALETALEPLRTLLNQIHNGEPIDTQPFDKQSGGEHELPGESQEKSA